MTLASHEQSFHRRDALRAPLADCFLCEVDHAPAKSRQSVIACGIGLGIMPIGPINFYDQPRLRKSEVGPERFDPVPLLEDQSRSGHRLSHETLGSGLMPANREYTIRMLLGMLRIERSHMRGMSRILSSGQCERHQCAARCRGPKASTASQRREHVRRHRLAAAIRPQYLPSRLAMRFPVHRVISTATSLRISLVGFVNGVGDSLERWMIRLRQALVPYPSATALANKGAGAATISLSNEPRRRDRHLRVADLTRFGGARSAAHVKALRSTRLVYSLTEVERAAR